LKYFALLPSCPHRTDKSKDFENTKKVVAEFEGRISAKIM